MDKNIASNWDLYLITILTVLLGLVFYFRRPPVPVAERHTNHNLNAEPHSQQQSNSAQGSSQQNQSQSPQPQQAPSSSTQPQQQSNQPSTAQNDNVLNND